MPNRPEIANKPNRDLQRVYRKGVMRIIRANKRNEAELRNEDSQPDKRRSYWRDRGFTRQSQAASLVTSIVADVNDQATANRQRSADWPMVEDQATRELLEAIFTDQDNRAETAL